MILVFSLISIAVAKVVEFKLDIQEGIISADYTNQKSILINNQFPGPEIRVNKYDDVKITVKNLLKDNFSMHFHGIDMKGSANMDGTSFITQYNIMPNQYYVYEFNVGDQAGTYYYHAQTKIHQTTCFGAFIVNDDNWADIVESNNEYKYDEEKTIIISDLFDRSNSDLYQGIVGNEFKAAVSPRSVLINGQTYNTPNRTFAEPTTEIFNQGHYLLNVEQNKSYRLRFIGASTVSYYTFHIQSHDLTIIEADGTLLTPIRSDRLMIHSGQRYSVILKANQTPRNYWMHAKIEERQDPHNGNAVLHYVGGESADTLVESPRESQLDVLSENMDWIYNNLSTSDYYSKNNLINNIDYMYPVPLAINKFFEFDMHTRYTQTSIKYAIKNVVFGEPDVLRPVVDPNSTDELYNNNGTIYSTMNSPLIEKLAKKEIYEIPGVYQINEGDMVEVLVSNHAGKDGSCYEHPFHLHGHHFYVVGRGSGTYNNKTDVLNLINPVFRDTAVVPKSPRTGTTYKMGCGWMVIRFKANNPGAWLFHDNINFLRLMGLQVAFMEVPNNY